MKRCEEPKAKFIR